MKLSAPYRRQADPIQPVMHPQRFSFVPRIRVVKRNVCMGNAVVMMSDDQPELLPFFLGLRSQGQVGVEDPPERLACNAEDNVFTLLIRPTERVVWQYHPA